MDTKEDSVVMLMFCDLERICQHKSSGFPGCLAVKNPPAMQEMQV